MSAGALVIKNAILALLVILIIHFAIKNILFEKEIICHVKEEMVDDVVLNASIPPPIVGEVPRLVPLPANPAVKVQCEKKESDLESLYNYVFSGTEGNKANQTAAKTELSVKQSKDLECQAANAENNGMFAAYDTREPMFSAW
jgi:hypothetical protein